MSDPKLISPLLDGFIMGDPISEHNGIRCCPAMNQQTNDKYIVKIISLPASQTQLDAMLLTGALQNEEDALQYYKQRADEIVADIQVLQNLARQDGFIPYTGYQIVPMEDATGFEVYILTEYRRSLQRQFVKNPLTHLHALNLGLDICSALTSCRRSGYLFTNLKPSNIFVTSTGEYKICDEGFISLTGMQFASIPEHHISSYTPPEIEDAFSSLNTTIDVYALGMILYSIYNGGQLPDANADEIAPPQYADEELSAIILKACSKKVEDRWQDPAQMGQMLVTYMQKNGASNEPIVPVVEIIPESVIEPAAESEETENNSIEAKEVSEPTEQDNITEPEQEPAEETSVPIAASPVEATEPTDLTQADSGEVSESALEDLPAEKVESAIEETLENDLPEQLSIDDISYDEVSDEVSQMLSQVDELADAEVPEPVVAPEAPEIVIPEQVETQNAGLTDTLGDLEGLKALLDESEETETDADSEEAEEKVPAAYNNHDDFYGDYEEEDEPAPRRSNWVRNLIIGLVIAAVLVGGFLFFRFYVLQSIDELNLIGSKDQLTVFIETEADESKLSISCTDIYGHEVTVPVINGEAHFSGLAADCEYNVTVNIAGLHLLQGKTTKNYFTSSITSIVQYSIVTGNTDGSAILSFTIDGPDSENWIFTYHAPGIVENTVTFSGHTVTLTGLEDKQTYTGTLMPQDDIFMQQAQEITFTASEVIQANDLTITSCMNNTLVAKWSAPESVEVAAWIVRCYNGTDYDKTLTVADTTAEFTGLDCKDSYTVEVTAEGQSVSQRTSIGENTITVYNIAADTSKAGVINLTWEADTIPAEGWKVIYSITDSEILESVACDKNSFTISPAVPGQEYNIVVTAADDTSVVCEPCICTTDDAVNFSVNYHGNHVTIDNLHFSMCRRPSNSNWSYKDVTKYTTRFQVNQKAAFVIYLDRKYDISKEIITTAFVICDENGKIVSIDSSSNTWSGMWFKNYCELNIPSLPDTPGNYSMYIYFNGQFAEKQSFSVE